MKWVVVSPGFFSFFFFFWSRIIVFVRVISTMPSMLPVFSEGFLVVIPFTLLCSNVLPVCSGALSPLSTLGLGHRPS